MSRRSVTRAVCAPLAIAIVTTAIPTAIHNSSAINHWTAKTWSVTLASTEAGMTRLGQEFGKHAEAGAEKIAQKRDELGAQLSAKIDQMRDEVGAQFSAAADTVASGTDAALARIDSLMTSVSQSVVAMLPSGADEPVVTAEVPPVEVKLPAREEMEETASIPAAAASSVSQPAVIEVEPVASALSVETIPTPSITAAIEPPAPQVAYQEPVKQALPEIEKTVAPAPVEKTVVAALESAKTILSTPAAAAVVPDMKIEAAVEAVRVTTEPVAEVKPALEMPVEAEAAPVREVKVVAAEKPPVVVETKIAVEPIPAIESKGQEAKAEEKPVVASLSHHLGPADTDAIAAPMRAIELKTQESQADKADEKPVVASLGPQQPVADAPVSEFKALPPSEPVASNSHVIDPLQMTNVPMSSPLKIRALTRADIPSAEKVASLGPSSTANNLPAEQQRVAYDAPIPLDEPTSIGRRKWTEEAAKYQGLGSPEALLEALKHMGAGAKSLGLPASLWCADFMNLVLRKSGIPATGSRAAKSYLQYGKKIDEPRVGAIAIFSRGANGGHIGIVRGTDGAGNPIIVSGNHNHKVAEAVYPKSRVIAYVVPR